MKKYQPLHDMYRTVQNKLMGKQRDGIITAIAQDVTSLKVTIEVARKQQNRTAMYSSHYSKSVDCQWRSPSAIL